jgi:hypothetical protein
VLQMMLCESVNQSGSRLFLSSFIVMYISPPMGVDCTYQDVPL